MRKAAEPPKSTRVAGEDLIFWWGETPRQPTTMAMLMLLDSLPEPERMRRAFERAVAGVPRLVQRVVDAPFDLTLPRWEWDPTFDLDYHVRWHTLAGPRDLDELFHEITPAYEASFDRSRPLWEARIYDGLQGVLDGRAKAALFFKLHHAVADGIGGNAIFSAMTDWERDPADPGSPPPELPRFRGAWPEAKPLGRRLVEAVQDRVALDVERLTAVAGKVADSVRDPEKIVWAIEAARSLGSSLNWGSQLPPQHGGRARRMSGMMLPFQEVRGIKQQFGGTMIDVILTIMARSMGKWLARQRRQDVSDLKTLVPLNLRKPEEWTEKVNVGNVATGIFVSLPIKLRSPLASFREIRRRMDAKKEDPGSHASPALAEIVGTLPRPFARWLAETLIGSVDLIVTNVPGILVPRYLARSEILAAYPFAPVAWKSPVSVALYGYRDHLHIGVTSDDHAMPDVDAFKKLIHQSFVELRDAARSSRPSSAKASTRTAAGALTATGG